MRTSLDRGTQFSTKAFAHLELFYHGFQAIIESGVMLGLLKGHLGQITYAKI
jgi:hypothetical protein